jgi:hypothetical protein
MSERDRADRSDPSGLHDVFEDLEQQAAGMQLSERDAELADRARGEYATVAFASRVHASLGRQVAVTLSGGEVVEGLLTQAGVDWFLLAPSGGQPLRLVRLAAVVAAYGLSARAVPEQARPAAARLGFGSALHRLVGDSPVVHVAPVTGDSLPVRVVRIGADFVEAEPLGASRPASSVLIPFTAIRVVRG